MLMLVIQLSVLFIPWWFFILRFLFELIVLLAKLLRIENVFEIICSFFVKIKTHLQLSLIFFTLISYCCDLFVDMDPFLIHSFNLSLMIFYLIQFSITHTYTTKIFHRSSQSFVTASACFYVFLNESKNAFSMLVSDPTGFYDTLTSLLNRLENFSRS